MFERYRTEEYRAKYALYGAKSFIGYRLRRLYVESAVWFPFPSIVLAWLRRRRYRWILPVGINCEPAFRFYRKWGFVESSLLGWAATSDLERTLHTLKGLDALLAGEVRYEDASRMWKCLNTGVSVHGKAAFEGEPSEAEKAADLQDLRRRMAHLKEKFLSSIRERPLFIHRLANADALRDDLAACLDAFEETLRDLGARDYTLLLICERRFLRRMPAGPNRIFRSVRHFNPLQRIADKRVGDPVGWRAIFTEFAPSEILPKRHAFKFE